jgi:hypothetical protein
METHQGEQDKGTEHPMSYEKEIATLRAVMEEAKTNPKVREHARKLLAENRPSSEQKSSERKRLAGVCLEWLTGTQAIPRGTIAITREDGVKRQAFSAEYDLKVDNLCGETVNDVFFTVTQQYTCPTDCRPGDPAGGGLGEKVTSVVGVPSTIENGQLSQGEASLFSYCEKVDSNGQVTELVVPSTVGSTAMAYGNDNEGVVVSPAKFL